MNETLKKQLMLGGLLFGAGCAYLYFTKNDEENLFEGISGLNIDLQPSHIIDSAVDKFVSDEQLGRGAKHLAKKLTFSMLG